MAVKTCREHAKRIVSLRVEIGHGCTGYASESFQRLLRDSNVACSMSRKGNCWDNVMTESFFATLKSERVHQERHTTRSDARSSIFDYIERFDNRKRRHYALGDLSPEQYEQRF